MNSTKEHVPLGQGTDMNTTITRVLLCILLPAVFLPAEPLVVAMNEFGDLPNHFPQKDHSC